MKNYFYLAALLSLGLVSSKCDNDDDNVETTDTEKPTFTAVRFEDTDVLTSTTEPEVHLGEHFEVNIDTKDNQELSELKVEVHENFDGHTHERSLASAVPVETGDTLSFSQVYSLSGTTASTEVHIFHDTDTNFVAGEYHLELQLLDKSGNSTQTVIAFDLGEDSHGSEGHEHAE